MKIALSWLRDYVEIHRLPQDLAGVLTMNGLAVESVLVDDPLPGIVIGKVLQVEKHPNADKLSLTRVDVGSEVLGIVCGAPNVQAGQWVPVAMVGTRLPGGLEIKKARIRGEESSGMICSKSELGFEEGKSPGIWELDSGREYRPGQRFGEYLNMGEAILDIDVTSNRPDCLSYIGVAREVAVVENTEARLPAVNAQEAGPDVQGAVRVTVEDSEGCPHYAARVILGVAVGPSPDWLVRRLEASGLRSINNIVDITHFAMLECGQPLHAFDYDRIAGHSIVVRRSRTGETFTTLDGRTHRLDDRVVLICDAERPVALGGIMGGKNSEVSDTTKNILLESAYFDPLRIRQSARALGITSDACMRFGRGVDPARTIYALDRAAELMRDLAGGQVARGIAECRSSRRTPPAIRLRSSAVTRLLAQDIPTETVSSILEKLGCRVTDRSLEAIEVVPPTHRPDLTIEVDLIEEVARIYGYNRLPSSRSAVVSYDQPENREEMFGRMVRSAFQEMGLYEVTTNSMVHPKYQTVVLPDAEEQFVRLINPLNDDMSVMRVSLLPSLLLVLRDNLNRDNKDVRVWELGRTYRYVDRGMLLPSETEVIAGCLSGQRWPANWDLKAESIDFFDLKRVVLGLCRKFAVDKLDIIPYHDRGTFDANSLEILTPMADGSSRRLGHFGRVSRAVLRVFDVKEAVWAFEIDHRTLFELAGSSMTARPVSRFPSVKRDLAFVVEEKVPAGSLLKFLREHGGEFLETVEIFDLYQGNQVGKGQKSLAFSLNFQAPERTLTEAEVDSTLRRLVEGAGSMFGAHLRT